MNLTGAGVWRPYAIASVAMSIVFGFGLGAGLFAVLALDRSIELWWIAAAQAHGHAQLSGWAGLMVLGVGFHFLPKLAGGSAVDPQRAMVVLLLFGGGIVVRVLCGVALAVQEGGDAWRLGVLAGSAAEFAGAIAAVVTLGIAVRFPAPLRLPAASSVAPLGILAMLSLVAAQLVSVTGAVDLVRSDELILPARTTELAQLIMQYGFLLPIAIAMSARLFPLYIRTSPATSRVLHSVAIAFAAGLLLRGIGTSAEREGLAATGATLLAIAGAVAIWSVGIFRKRRPLPRKQVRVVTDPLQIHVVSAYIWLIVALVASIEGEVDEAGIVHIGISPTIERHAFGAGFVTILILGVGQVLLPGFDRATMRRQDVLWATLVLGNISALLRVVPATGWDAFGQADRLMSLAGVTAVAAILCFAWNSGLFRARVTRRDRVL